MSKALVNKLEDISELKGLGQGQWQCIIADNIASSLSYDCGLIMFYYIIKYRKSILIFKSG